MGFDPECLALARYFLPDKDPEVVAQLAQEIQDTVERFEPEDE